jgi:hypothetical protein
MELLKKVIEILLNDVPAFLEEFCIEPIWSRGFVIVKILNHCINLFMGEGSFQE